MFMFISQYTVLEKNKLDCNTQQSKTILSLRNYLLKTGWPIPKSIYNIHNPKGLTLLNRLKVGLSHLNLHKFNHSFRDCVNPLCPCSLEIESSFDFFLHCHYVTDIRKTFFKGMLRRNIEHFLEKTDIWKIRIFWNKLTEKFFFLFSTVCVFYFCKNLNPRLYDLFLVYKYMT